jgi:hypothetical protein
MAGSMARGEKSPRLRSLWNISLLRRGALVKKPWPAFRAPENARERPGNVTRKPLVPGGSLISVRRLVDNDPPLLFEGKKSRLRYYAGSQAPYE